MAIERKYDPFSPHVAAPVESEPKQQEPAPTPEPEPEPAPEPPKTAKRRTAKKASEKAEEPSKEDAETVDPEAAIAAQLAELDNLREQESQSD